jgi:hypothetical protein
VSLTTDTANAESSTKTWFDRLTAGIGYLISNTPALGPALKALGFVNDKIRDQADALKQNSQVTSNVTKVMKDLTLVEETKTKTTKKSNDAAERAAALAKKQAQAYAEAQAAALKLRYEIQDLADALRDRLNVRLDDAKEKLKTAQDAFDDFGKSVGAAITGSFNFGAAQSEASGNSSDLQKALDDQADAQKKVNDAQADFNFFRSDDYAKVLKERLDDLAVATGKVSAAQAKPLTFFDALAKQADKAKKFGELVNRLIAGGLSEAALSQVLAAGVDGGTAIATEILGSADGVLKANTLTQSMTDLADEMGKRAATKYYGAGVTAATEFLKGVKDTIDKVEVTLKKPNLGTIDVINAGIAAMTPQDVIDLQVEIGRYLQGGNFGMGVPMMAEGGIVTSPTLAMIGEGRGPEAIIPLEKMSSMGFGGNGGGITINVQGGDPNAVVQALRNYMRQNGSIPIKTANLY